MEKKEAFKDVGAFRRYGKRQARQDPVGTDGAAGHDRGDGGLARGERGDQSKYGAVLQIALYVAAVCTCTN
jgi:hypothetical protein